MRLSVFTTLYSEWYTLLFRIFQFIWNCQNACKLCQILCQNALSALYYMGVSQTNRISIQAGIVIRFFYCPKGNLYGKFP